MIRGKNQAAHALMEQALCAGKKVAFADARGSWYITRTNGVTTWTPVPITYERRLPELVIYDEADDFDANALYMHLIEWRRTR